MTKQLSLFPTSFPDTVDHLQDAGLTEFEGVLNPVDEVFATNTRCRNSHNFMDLLDFIARFPNYSAFNGLLLYIQKPSATHVATARTWVQKFRRRPSQNARPLAILAPMAPIRFVFDVSDTEGPPIPSGLLSSAGFRNKLPGSIYSNTLHNCPLQGIAVCDKSTNPDMTGITSRLTPALRKKYTDLNLQKDSGYLIHLDEIHDLEDKYSSLAHELGHIFCGHLGIDRHAWWPERDNLHINGQEIEAESVAYLICRRKGLQACAEKYLSGYAGKNIDLPAFSLNAVLQAVTYVEEMGKRRWKVPKKKRQN